MTFNILPISCSWFIIVGIILLIGTITTRNPILLRYGAPIGIILTLLGFFNTVCN